MESRVEKTLVPGKLVREPTEAFRRVLASEVQSGEVVVSLLETATELTLHGGSAKVWVALTDRRALALAVDEQGTSKVEAVDASTVERRGKFGRDEITLGDQTYKCPLMRGGSEFKQFAQLAAVHPVERIRQAARMRLDEGQAEAAVALAEAGLDQERDPTLLTLRVLALIETEAHHELGLGLTDLVRGDPDLSHWKELETAIDDDSQLLTMLYTAANEAGIAAKVRSRLPHIRTAEPKDAATVELAATMDADEGQLDKGLDRLVSWREDNKITAKSFLSAAAILAAAGLDSEPFHRHRATALAEVGRLAEALEAADRALFERETPQTLRVKGDLLIRANRAADAVEPLERLLELGEDDYWVRSHLAEGQEARKQLDEAVTHRELALAQLDNLEEEPERSAAERRALARLHRSIAAELSDGEREMRIAYADLLERGLDWAARLVEVPEKVFAGSTLEATVEILAARQLTQGRTSASLSFVEEIIAPKAEQVEIPEAPSLLAGGIAGTWPREDEEEEKMVNPGKKGARVRYPVGKPAWVGLDDGQSRGLHRASVNLPVPTDIRPSYGSEQVRAVMELQLSPPGARFPVEVLACHDPGAETGRHAEEREGTGKIDTTLTVENTAWSFGRPAAFHLSARLNGDRIPTFIEASLLATERMRPPHKGERPIETLTWTFPVFRHERRRGIIERDLHLDLPDEGLCTGLWTWFELYWELRVRLLRKDRPESSAEVPVLLLHPPQPAEPDEAGQRSSSAVAVDED